MAIIYNAFLNLFSCTPRNEMHNRTNPGPDFQVLTHDFLVSGKVYTHTHTDTRTLNFGKR